MYTVSREAPRAALMQEPVTNRANNFVSICDLSVYRVACLSCPRLLRRFAQPGGCGTGGSSPNHRFTGGKPVMKYRWYCAGAFLAAASLMLIAPAHAQEPPSDPGAPRSGQARQQSIKQITDRLRDKT